MSKMTNTFYIPLMFLPSATTVTIFGHIARYCRTRSCTTCGRCTGTHATGACHCPIRNFQKLCNVWSRQLQTIADDCRRDPVDYRSRRPPACRHLQTCCRCSLLTCRTPKILPPASSNLSKASQGPPRCTLQQSPAHSSGITCRIGLRERDGNGCASPVFRRDIGGRYVLLSSIHVVS